MVNRTRCKWRATIDVNSMCLNSWLGRSNNNCGSEHHLKQWHGRHNWDDSIFRLAAFISMPCGLSNALVMFFFLSWVCPFFFLRDVNGYFRCLALAKIFENQSLSRSCLPSGIFIYRNEINIGTCGRYNIKGTICTAL